MDRLSDFGDLPFRFDIIGKKKVGWKMLSASTAAATILTVSVINDL